MTDPTGKGRRLTRCRVCRSNPVAMKQVSYCFACWPGGPVVPPPCLKCGTHADYYAAGLCIRCHPWGDPGPDSCRDCMAWGARRTNKWLCIGCCHWRVKYSNPANGGGIGPCSGCRRTLMLGARGVCRLCHKQATFARDPKKPFDPIGANKHGQQLFLADMFTRHKTPTRRPGQLSPGARAELAATGHRQGLQQPVPHWLTARDQQLALFTMKPGLAAHGRAGLHQRAHPDDVAPLEAVARRLAADNQWSRRQLKEAIIGTRIMLGVQDNGRAPIRASEVEALRDIDMCVWTVLEVLATAGALNQDRPPSHDLCFAQRADGLPDPMNGELRTWFDIMNNGSTTAPRRRPRSKQTITLHLSWALPFLRAWADDGFTSLRQISRHDVLAALPPGGNPRSQAGQGLKSIFRLLKDHRVLFTNPTARVKTGEHSTNTPLPLDTALVRNLLLSQKPSTALIVALIAFHGLRMTQLQELLLTDIRDGRLTLRGRAIPLAEPVLERLAAWLDHRATTWPDTTSGYLFVNQRSVRRNQPVGYLWLHRSIGPGVTARKIREDRSLSEAHATGGDVRAIADLFGLSINASTRYLSTLEADDLTPTPRPGPTRDRRDR